MTLFTSYATVPSSPVDDAVAVADLRGVYPLVLNDLCVQGEGDAEAGQQDVANAKVDQKVVACNGMAEVKLGELHNYAFNRQNITITYIVLDQISL